MDELPNSQCVLRLVLSGFFGELEALADIIGCLLLCMDFRYVASVRRRIRCTICIVIIGEQETYWHVAHILKGQKKIPQYKYEI